MNYYAMIVAGGSGSRMQNRVPKQFLLLNDRPVIMHTMEAFHRSSCHPAIILVLNPAAADQWADLCREYEFTVPHEVVPGGASRFESVRNGLSVIAEEGIVAVHDAVRPVISEELILRAFREAERSGTAVPAILSRDSVRQGSEESSRALDRQEIFLVQTPQTFRSDILRKAYEQPYRETYTDDASVVEASGVRVRMIEGDAANIKITFPGDLSLAGFYLNRQK